jgi:hypothetical protein
MFYLATFDNGENLRFETFEEAKEMAIKMNISKVRHDNGDVFYI